MAYRKRTATTKFPVKKRKELGDNLASVDCEEVASKAIDRVLGSLHCNHFTDRRQFLSEQKSRKELLECVKTMVRNFGSSYMTYLPRKRFAEFQHAWFTQARNYIYGECTEAVPSTSDQVGLRTMVQNLGLHPKIAKLPGTVS